MQLFRRVSGIEFDLIMHQAHLAEYKHGEGRYTPREKVALRYADAIMYDPAQADDGLWAELHAEFTEPELVELGYWIGFTFGGQRWLKTLVAQQREFAASLAANPASKRIVGKIYTSSRHGAASLCITI